MTQTQEQRTFDTPPVAPQPITSNVGRIVEVSDAYKSKNFDNTGYWVIKMVLDAIGAGKSHTFWLTYKPEWLKFGFQSRKLEGQKGNPLRLYKQNISDSESVSLLQGIAGLPENYGELCSLLDAVDVDPDSEPEEYGKAIGAAFNQFFNENKPLIGYVLKQGQERVKNDEGKTEYIRSKFMEVDRWFYPTDKNLDYERKLAERSAKKIQAMIEANENSEEYKPIPSGFKVTFDEKVPF